MIEVKFKRLDFKKGLPCDCCMSDIQIEQPHFEIYLDAIGQTIHLCEDCGNDLQNDMSDEYCKFIDLGL